MQKHRKSTNRFAQGFEMAFSKPNLSSQKFNELWMDLESVADALAGPILSILEDGNCEYVYRHDDNRFPGVRDFPTFKSWAKNLGHEYHEKAQAVTADTETEIEDKRKLQEKANAMLDIVQLAEEEIALQGHLEELGYDSRWFNLGVIDEESLPVQINEYNSSEDKNKEHYRFAAFVSFLKSKSILTDEDFDEILQLEDHGTDNCDLSDTIIIELIRSGLLNDEQYERLKGHPKANTAPVLKIYRRYRIIRKLNMCALSNEIIEEAKGSNDPYIHQLLIEHKDLNIQTLHWLTVKGASKKIRNMAGALEKTKRFRRQEQ